MMSNRSKGSFWGKGAANDDVKIDFSAHCPGSPPFVDFVEQNCLEQKHFSEQNCLEQKHCSGQCLCSEQFCPEQCFCSKQYCSEQCFCSKQFCSKQCFCSEHFCSEQQLLLSCSIKHLLFSAPSIFAHSSWLRVLKVPMCS